MNISKNLIEIIKKKLNEILLLRNHIKKKEDNSYVSEGDLLVESLLIDYLSKCLRNHRIISEERIDNENKSYDIEGSYIFIDPIDGTENFISGLKEWGVGVSIFTNGRHQESLIYLPELNEYQITGMKINNFRSRIYGISSSLSKSDLEKLPLNSHEFRIIGCSMYNLLSVARGSFNVFENVKGVNCWDILPGINIAKEHGCKVYIDHEPYKDEILFPNKKYKVKVINSWMLK